MRKALLILGEIAVTAWLIGGVDHIGYLWAWLPFIIYNVAFCKQLVDILPKEWFY